MSDFTQRIQTLLAAEMDPVVIAALLGVGELDVQKLHADPTYTLTAPAGVAGPAGPAGASGAAGSTGAVGAGLAAGLPGASVAIAANTWTQGPDPTKLYLAILSYVWRGNSVAGYDASFQVAVSLLANHTDQVFWGWSDAETKPANAGFPAGNNAIIRRQTTLLLPIGGYLKWLDNGVGGAPVDASVSVRWQQLS